MKRNYTFTVIFILTNISAQSYNNDFDHVWQDLPWGDGGYFPASSIISMEGPFDADGDGQQEFLISSSWTGAIGNDMGIYEVAGDDSLELIWYVDLINYGINLPSNVSKATTADLDNDGLLEVLLIIDVSPDNFNGAGAAGTDYDSFSVWEFDSTTGSFPTIPTTTWDMAVTDVIEVGEIAVDDIDGDGVQEVAVSLTTGWDESTGLFNAGRFMIFSLDQAYTLETAVWNIEMIDLTTTVAPGYLTRITDLDNDGLKEVIFVAWEWFRLIIYEAIIGDVYIKETDFYVADQATHFCSGGAFEANFDGDETNELYFVTTQSYAGTIPYEDGNFYVLTNNGDISEMNFTDNVHWLYSFPESSFGYDMRGLAVGNQDSPLGQNPDGADIYIAGGWTGNIYNFEYTGDDITDPNNYSLDTLWSAPNYGSNDSWFRPSRIVTGYFDDDNLGDILIASMDYENFNTPHVVWLEHDYEYVNIQYDEHFSNPKDFDLMAVYPNPFNPKTTIQFNIVNKSKVLLQIYDITGRLVETLLDRIMLHGNHEIIWNAENLPSGIYFSIITSGNLIKTHKLILMK
jgi:hypothetical protein